jgi:succinoglycan biosynthesis transport protein ExoP
MFIKQLISILRARWKNAFYVFLTVFVIGASLTLFLPKRYRAVATVVVNSSPSDQVGAAAVFGEADTSFMSTQVEIITSERTAILAQHATGVDKDSRLKEDFEQTTSGKGNFDSWLAARTLRNLQVKPSTDSNVIAISYTDRDSAKAAAMANAFVAAYATVVLEMRLDIAQQGNQFVQRRSKELLEALVGRQRALADYQLRNDVVLSDNNTDRERTRLDELHAQLTQLEVVASQSRERSNAAAKQPALMDDVQRSQIISAISTDLIRRQSALSELEQRFGPDHPQVQEARRAISEMRRQVEIETRRIGDRLRIASQIDAGRVAELKALIDSQRERVLARQQLDNTISVLRQEVQTAQRLYDTSLQKLSAADTDLQNQRVGVSVLKAATEPSVAWFPKVMFMMAATIVAGLVFGLGAAMIKELRDRRVRGRADIERELALPLIATVKESEVGELKTSEVSTVRPSKNSLQRATDELQTQWLMRAHQTETRGKGLAFISPDAGESKSLLATNLALALSRSGARTLLVNTDVEVNQGVRLLITKDSYIEDASDVRELTIAPEDSTTPRPDLYVVSADRFKPGTAQCLNLDAFKQMMQKWLIDFDHVIVDTSVEKSGIDPRLASIMCGTALLVVYEGRTKMENLSKLVEDLRGCGTDIFGSVCIE